MPLGSFSASEGVFGEMLSEGRLGMKKNGSNILVIKKK